MGLAGYAPRQNDRPKAIAQSGQQPFSAMKSTRVLGSWKQGSPRGNQSETCEGKGLDVAFRSDSEAMVSSSDGAGREVMSESWRLSHVMVAEVIEK